MKPNPGKIVIFGQYKSGTTGLFTKIHHSLPPATRVLFEPLAYTPEPEDANRWVLAKTILKFANHPQPVDEASFLAFDRRLYLIRDPRDWLVSSTLFLCQEKAAVYGDPDARAWVMDYLARKEAAPRSLALKELLDFIMRAAPAMTTEFFCARTQGLQARCIAFEQRHADNLFHIRYEDFVDGRLDPLAAYLEFPLHGDAEVDPSFAHVPRTRGHGNWRAWFTADDVDFFAPYFADYIAHYGYDHDWRLDPEPRIEARHASDYVARVMHRKLESIPPAAH